MSKIDKCGLLASLVLWVFVIFDYVTTGAVGFQAGFAVGSLFYDVQVILTRRIKSLEARLGGVPHG